MTSIHDSDPGERKTSWIFASGVVGALVPLFWIVMGFLLFNMPQSRASDLFGDAVYITCPSWLLPADGVVRSREQIGCDSKSLSVKPGRETKRGYKGDGI
jgi:hypothetical protein